MNNIELLRRELKRSGINACVIPTSDPHLSEYLSEHYKFRHWLCPFSGSAGTLVVTQKGSGLWTDGRYYIQAETELDGTETVLFRASEKGTPTVAEFLSDELSKGSKVSIYGKIQSKQYIDKLSAQLGKKDITLVCDKDFSYIWNDRPEKPCGKVSLMPKEFSGESTAEKLTRLRGKMKSGSFTHYISAAADSNMYLLNIRGCDVSYTPVALCYVMVSMKKCFLYIDGSMLDKDVCNVLEKNGVTVKEYDDIYSDAAKLSEKSYVAADFSMVNYSLINAVKGGAFKNTADFISEMKCIKNKCEIENIKKAYIKENTALVKSFYEIYNSDAKITETDVCEIIEKHRKSDADYMYPSFETIAAYGANAAMMHYSPEKGNCAVIEKRGMLLIDTGAQSLYGTTDTTRTLIMGNISEEERENYTLVLKGNIALTLAVFPENTKSSAVDFAARQFLWKRKLDYRCGTGHGVGCCLCVHEVPPRISQASDKALIPGMTVTNEPGIYVEGKYGIRIENHLCVVEKGESEYGKFLGFEVLNYCPIGTHGLKCELLTSEEKQWINEYNRLTREMLCEYLSDEVVSWLAVYTQEV